MQKNYFRLFVLTPLLFSNSILTAIERESLLSDNFKKNFVIAAGATVVFKIFSDYLLSNSAIEAIPKNKPDSFYKNFSTNESYSVYSNLAIEIEILEKKCIKKSCYSEEIEEEEEKELRLTKSKYKEIINRTINSLVDVKKNLAKITELEQLDDSKLSKNIRSCHSYNYRPHNTSVLFTPNNREVLGSIKKNSIEKNNLLLKTLIEIVKTEVKIEALYHFIFFNTKKIDLNPACLSIFLSCLNRHNNTFFYPFLGTALISSSFAAIDIYNNYQKILNLKKNIADLNDNYEKCLDKQKKRLKLNPEEIINYMSLILRNKTIKYIGPAVPLDKNIINIILDFSANDFHEFSIEEIEKFFEKKYIKDFCYKKNEEEAKTRSLTKDIYDAQIQTLLSSACVATALCGVKKCFVLKSFFCET